MPPVTAHGEAAAGPARIRALSEKPQKREAKPASMEPPAGRTPTQEKPSRSSGRKKHPKPAAAQQAPGVLLLRSPRTQNGARGARLPPKTATREMRRRPQEMPRRPAAEPGRCGTVGSADPSRFTPSPLRLQGDGGRAPNAKKIPKALRLRGSPCVITTLQMPSGFIENRAAARCTNQSEARRSGSGLERRSDGMNER